MVEQTDHPDMNALSLVDRLFVLLVVNPEIDIHMIEEILSSKSYYNKTITKWKKAGTCDIPAHQSWKEDGPGEVSGSCRALSDG